MIQFLWAYIWVIWGRVYPLDHFYELVRLTPSYVLADCGPKTLFLFNSAGAEEIVELETARLECPWV